VYMYKAGWAMNVGFILYTAMIVVALLAVGAVFYNEAVSFTAMAGIILTSSGMYMIVRGA
jgi:drug/metabolite transporter (DMT)-like permease